MKLLILGGTYFLGRVFTLEALKHHEVTLINRGTYHIEHTISYHFDRHDLSGWQSFPKDYYDVVIDFCAYTPDDFMLFYQHMKGYFKHYILISTVDVLKHLTHQKLDEDAVYEDYLFAGKEGEYILNKVALEKYIQSLNINYAIIRPGFIYGPYNYVPRETQLIQYVIDGMPLVTPLEATSEFQMVYVYDVSQAIFKAMEYKLYKQCFNIISEEKITYASFNQALANASQKEVPIISLPINQLYDLHYPLPFPLKIDECEQYDGSKISKLTDFKYTSLQNGLKKTYEAFYPIMTKG